MDSLRKFAIALKNFTNSLSSINSGSQSSHEKHYLTEAQKLETLEAAIGEEKCTHTQAITSVYNFNQKNNLTEITYELARERFLEKNSERRAKLSKGYEDSKAMMKEVRKFNKFAESIVPKETLQGKPNVLSGMNQPQGERWTYQKPSSEGDNVGQEDNLFNNSSASDKAAYMEGKGIALNPRLEGERVDPQHRAWGTMFAETMRKLYEPYDNWVNGDLSSNEDLPVAIALAGTELEQQVSVKNKYFTPQEAMRHIVTSNNGILCDRDGNQLGSALHNRYIFVMDMQGNLFVHSDNCYMDMQGNLFEQCDDYYIDSKRNLSVSPGGPNFEEFNRTKKRIGHPAFTQGEPVACAGELEICNGKITTINNYSGHYSPQSFSLFRVTSALQQRGVLATKCQIRDFGRTSNNPGLVFDINNPSNSTIQGEKIPDPAFSPDLSEKHNPIYLLESLTQVNLYLKDRAKETSFFGYYGRNYEARKEHFQSVLEKLSEGKYQDALTLIDEGMKTFDGTFFQSRYVACLEKLKSSLESKDGILENPHVKQRLVAYKSVYNEMNKVTSAVSDYDNAYSYFGDNSQALAAISERNIQYLAIRKKFADIKKELPNDRELRRTAYQNVEHR